MNKLHPLVFLIVALLVFPFTSFSQGLENSRIVYASRALP